jgi:DNA-binding transcriptional MerR regulator
MSKDGFSTREVQRLTGTTARQLQWWDEKRIIVPTRDGRNRLYSAEDLVEIHVIEELRRRHISLAAVRRVLRFLRRETGVRLSKLASGASDYHLLLDGRNLYLETDSKQIVNLIRNTTQPVFVICLSDAARRVEVALPKVEDIPAIARTSSGTSKRPATMAAARIRKREVRASAS